MRLRYMRTGSSAPRVQVQVQVQGLRLAICRDVLHWCSTVQQVVWRFQTHARTKTSTRSEANPGPERYHRQLAVGQARRAGNEPRVGDALLTDLEAVLLARMGWPTAQGFAAQRLPAQSFPRSIPLDDVAGVKRLHSKAKQPCVQGAEAKIGLSGPVKTPEGTLCLCAGHQLRGASFTPVPDPRQAPKTKQKTARPATLDAYKTYVTGT